MAKTAFKGRSKLSGHSVDLGVFFEKARALSNGDIQLPDTEIEDLKKFLTHESDFILNPELKGFIGETTGGPSWESGPF